MNGNRVALHPSATGACRREKKCAFGRAVHGDVAARRSGSGRDDEAAGEQVGEPPDSYVLLDQSGAPPAVGVQASSDAGHTWMPWDRSDGRHTAVAGWRARPRRAGGLAMPSVCDGPPGQCG